MNLSPFAFLKSCTISHIWEDVRLNLIAEYDQEGGIVITLVDSENTGEKKTLSLNPVQVEILREVLKQTPKIV